MSFPNQGFWMRKGSLCLNDGVMAYDTSSRIEPKRSHQWLVDGPDTDLFSSKKQAVEVPTTNIFTRMLNSNNSWGNASSFHSISEQFAERLFDAEIGQAVNFDDQSMPSVSTVKVDMARKVNEDLLTNDSSFGLSMSHTLEDPRSEFHYEGIRKLKVCQVKDSEDVMSASVGHVYSRVDNNSVSTGYAYNKFEDSLAFNKGDENIVSIGGTCERENNIFMSMGQSYNKSEDSVPAGSAYKESNNAIAINNTFNKDGNNFVSVGQTYNQTDDSPLTVGHTYSKGDESTISISHSYQKGDSNNLSIGQSYRRGQSTIISFGGYNDDDINLPGRLITGYDSWMGQHSVQRSDAPNENELVKSNAGTLLSTCNLTSSGAEVSRKKEEMKTSKKAPSNNFPSNVRSLLSTGMLDGVPVKYIAWSQEKELRGVIKSSGYQCGCQTCNFSKVINAYEFERHAGCKTKHPNNHIYFENGKTIYGTVQELRSTPQNMLFDVIQTITGSPINQKCFQLWKESFLAATVELQRIYGKHEGKHEGKQLL